MKIENTKLMIGDKVKSQTGIVHTIVGISHDNPHEYTPIPLTEELLNNNGGSYNRIDNEEHTIYYRYSADGGVFIELIEDGDEMTPSRTIFARELDYVHQYQHLLRLCGLNDLANNFKIE